MPSSILQLTPLSYLHFFKKLFFIFCVLEIFFEYSHLFLEPFIWRDCIFINYLEKLRNIYLTVSLFPWLSLLESISCICSFHPPYFFLHVLAARKSVWFKIPCNSHHEIEFHPVNVLPTFSYVILPFLLFFSSLYWSKLLKNDSEAFRDPKWKKSLSPMNTNYPLSYFSYND